MWVSTIDTAHAVRALARYAEVTRELSPDYTYAVALGQQHIAEGRMGPEDVHKPARVVALSANDLKEGANVLEIAKIVGAKRAYLKGGSPSCDRDGITGEFLQRGGLSVVRVP